MSHTFHCSYIITYFCLDNSNVSWMNLSLDATVIYENWSNIYHTYIYISYIYTYIIYIIYIWYIYIYIIYIYHILQCLMGIISGFQSYRNSMGFPSYFLSVRCVFWCQEAKEETKQASISSTKEAMRCCLFNGSWLFNGCGKWLFDLVSMY